MDNAPLTPARPSDPDANGFDPDDFDWFPVARRRRADGWTPPTQRAFIEALADTGSVRDAARAVGMSPMSCYRLRRAPGAEQFAAAWDAAIGEASKQLVDIAFDRAVNGVEEPVLDLQGNPIYMRTRYNDRLLMFLLRAHHPDRYGTHRRDAAPAADPAALPVARAIAALEPVPPADLRLPDAPDAPAPSASPAPAPDPAKSRSAA